MSLKLPAKIGINKLQLADVVSLEMSEGYDTATVEQITDKTVRLIRPYVATADFSCTSGVITYLGWEYVNLYWYDTDIEDNAREVVLLRRTELK